MTAPEVVEPVIDAAPTTAEASPVPPAAAGSQPEAVPVAEPVADPEPMRVELHLNRRGRRALLAVGIILGLVASGFLIASLRSGDK